jgi:ACR3 family arsenite efflux pump ArsB
MAPPANHWRCSMLTLLLFLWLIVVVFDLKVKLVIERP